MDITLSHSLHHLSVSSYPFQEHWYLDLYSRSFSSRPFMITVKLNGTTVLFPFEKAGETLILLGMKKVLSGQDLTDYGDIIATVTDEKLYRSVLLPVMEFVKNQGIRQVSFDYVREDGGLYRALKVYPGAEVVRQEVSPFLRLTSSWDAYLEALPRVERKELKRKLKRLNTVTQSFEIIPASNETVFGEFIHLHRISDKNKKKFMSSEMVEFFREVAFSSAGYWTKSFAKLSIKNKPAAIILFFENKERALLYNSGYDPAYGYYSSGLMAHALLIKRNIELGIRVHDFLRGAERYKYDLGAQNMNLYKISINL